MGSSPTEYIALEAVVVRRALSKHHRTLVWVQCTVVYHGWLPATQRVFESSLAHCGVGSDDVSSETGSERARDVVRSIIRGFHPRYTCSNRVERIRGAPENGSNECRHTQVVNGKRLRTAGTGLPRFESSWRHPRIHGTEKLRRTALSR